MSYRLEVKFTGVLAFVKHSRDARYRVVMPHGHKKRNALNNGLLGDLVPHNPFLYVRPEAPNSLPLGNRPLPLHQERVSFSFPGNQVSTVSVDSSFKYLPLIQDTNQSLKTSEQAVSDTPDPELVSVQVDVQTGELKTDHDKEWMIPLENVGGTPYSDPIAHSVIWTVPELEDAVSVQLDSFNGSGSLAFTVGDATHNGVASIVIASHSSLFRPLHDQLPGPRKPDTDWRWHYELLDTGSKSAVANRLLSNGKPIPIPEPQGTGGGGQDCNPSMLPPCGCF